MKRHMLGRTRFWRLGFTALVMALAAASASAAGHGGSAAAQAASRPGARVAAPVAPDGQTGSYGSVVLGGSPGAPASDPRTGTVYVPVQCTTDFCNPNTPAHVMDVINAATCNAADRSGCRVVAQATVGNSPIAAAVDEQSDTVYVTNGNDGTVSVVDGARCNATITTGCGKPLATIKVGALPVAAAFNPATRTVYVANLNGGSVSVINAAGCNAVTTSGCGQPARTVKDPAGPDGIDVDVATDTVYAANSGTASPQTGDTVSVIDGATCNGTNGAGCGRTPVTTTVGSGALWDAVDQASDTVYVANNNDGTVSVINGAGCNARVRSACASTWPTVTTGANVSFVAVEDPAGTVFAGNPGDNTLSAISTATCDGTVTSGCGQRAPNQQASPDTGSGYNPFPAAFALVPQTGTAYLVNEGGPSILTVVSVSGCTAADDAGCRADAPAVPDHESAIAADPATGTCNGTRTSGCTGRFPTMATGRSPLLAAIDTASDTIYVTDFSSAGVTILDGSRCNASVTTGCGAPLRGQAVGSQPFGLAIDQQTGTVYVTDLFQAGSLSLLATAGY
jgi:DNA-binding beta-propeller fold protein YncE